MALTTHPPSNAVGKERVELYLYSPLGLRGLLQGELLSTLNSVLQCLTAIIIHLVHATPPPPVGEPSVLQGKDYKSYSGLLRS